MPETRKKSCSTRQIFQTAALGLKGTRLCLQLSGLALHLFGLAGDQVLKSLDLLLHGWMHGWGRLAGIGGGTESQRGGSSNTRQRGEPA